jgi:hypothetical protein
MSKEPTEPLRGHAAWKAAKQRISERNEAAYARGRQERAARNADAIDRRRQADRRDSAKLPRQPGER